MQYDVVMLSYRQPALAEDDITLSYAVSAKTGNSNYVCAGFSYTDVAHQRHDGGNEHRSDHYMRRDSAIMTLQRLLTVGKSYIVGK